MKNYCKINVYVSLRFRNFNIVKLKSMFRKDNLGPNMVFFLIGQIKQVYFM